MSISNPRRLRVVMYSAMAHEISALETEMKQHPESHVIDLVYVSAKLDESTAALAAGAKAVNLFASDHTEPRVLETLKALGIELVTLRYASVPYGELLRVAQSGIRVAPAPAHAPTSIAEYTVTLMLSLNRKIHLASSRVRDGNLTSQGLAGFEMRGKTVGIIGTGTVGGIVAGILLSGFRCKVLAFDMMKSQEIIAKGAKYVSMDTLLAKSDIISLHAPLVPGTRHMIGRRTLPLCKRGVYVINTSRGGLIDLKAAIEALQSGRMGGLALDVFEEQANMFLRDQRGVHVDLDFEVLNSMPNVIITVHQSGLTTNALASVAKVTLKTLMQFYRGERLTYEIKPGDLVGGSNGSSS